MSLSTPPPVRACIFDVDGTLINSEDVYTDVYNHVLHAHGKPSLPWRIKAMQQSKGREVTLPSVYISSSLDKLSRSSLIRLRQGQQLILDWASLDLPVSDWGAQCRTQHHRFKACKLLPGVDHLLHSLSPKTEAVPEVQGDHPQPIYVAIASSSTTTSFQTKTSHLPTFAECIPRENCVFGDDPEMSDARKKPKPDIFLLALERLNKAGTASGRTEEFEQIKPNECLVFEDSIAGVEAGRRAGMRVVWIPDEGLRKTCEGKLGAVLNGRMDWNKESEDEEALEEGPKNSLKLKDGWAEILSSMEDFDGNKYGIHITKDDA